MTPHMARIDHPSVWTGADLHSDQSWRISLTAEQNADLAKALQHINDRGLQFAEIRQEDFPLPSLTEALQRVLHEVRDGRGFAVLAGFPTDRYETDDLEKLYWGLCTHLGTGVTQNSEAGLIHYVTDGTLRPQQGARILGRPGVVNLHVDLADCVSLFCLRQAPDDPHSSVASSMRVYNEILRQHPEYLPRLYEGFVWNRIETPPSELTHSGFKIPAYSAADGVVTCRFHPGWIRAGMNRAEETLTDQEEEMFTFIAETAAANRYDFPLGPGDVAFFNNYTVFHGRAAHEPIEDEAQKRVLQRIWLDLPDVRPFADEATVRYGAVRHGKMGWTAADVLSGAHNTPHRRRDDGVPEAA
jgi:hypothetical protein